MGNPLGPISSTAVGGERGRRNFYVDLTNQLDSGETVTGTPTVTSGSAAVTVDNIAVNTTEIIDGNRTVGVGKAVEFRATTTDDLEGIVALTLHYETTDGNYDTAELYLRVRAAVV